MEVNRDQQGGSSRVTFPHCTTGRRIPADDPKLGNIGRVISGSGELRSRISLDKYSASLVHIWENQQAFVWKTFYVFSLSLEHCFNWAVADLFVIVIISEFHFKINHPINFLGYLINLLLIIKLWSAHSNLESNNIMYSLPFTFHEISSLFGINLSAIHVSLWNYWLTKPIIHLKLTKQHLCELSSLRPYGKFQAEIVSK